MIDKIIIYNKVQTGNIFNNADKENAYTDFYRELSYNEFKFAIEKCNSLPELHRFITILGGWKPVQSLESTAKKEEI